MTQGLTAALTVSLTGASASAYGQEVDLMIDPAGDLLDIDPAGDVLMVTPGFLDFTGGTASIVAADPLEVLQSEGWEGFQTESGEIIETEGT